MDRDPEGQQVMSLRLTRVMSDIGVNRQMVTRRRKTFLSKEKIDTVWNNLKSHTHNSSYYFGSQSEGTTTLDMNSDVDQLNCFNQCNVMLDVAEWKQGKLNLLMMKNDRSPPQHCCLQMFRSDCPRPCTNVPPEIHVERDIDGRVILTNTWIDTLYKEMYGRYFIKQGPSRSMMKEMDIVNAVYCKTTPPECRTLFSRPKPGHWPRPDILVRSSQYGIFLVPQGHAESDQSNLEWRFSTAQIERLLMFDLCIVKIQAYTFLKVLRKTFFKPLVGDRLSTFHFKTALLFTVETHPPNIWQENNLLQCVVYCLKTLQRWFKLRSCPHYTISGVDLFVGKLRKWEFPLLSTVLTDMIDNIMNFVCKIEMDQIGDRVGGRFIAVSTRHQYALLLNSSFYKLAGQNYHLTKKKEDIFQIRNLITKALEIQLPSLITVEIMHSIKFLYQLLASLSASICLQRNQPIPSNIYFLYEASLDSDLTSSRLKLASMLYCSGQYERASLVLAHTEELLQADVMQWCPCARETNQVPTERFIQRVLELPEHEVMKSYVACSVYFNLLEIYCMPAFLRYEMMRTIGPDGVQHNIHPVDEDWMGLAVIDSIPFLYYMQYLTYRQLGEQDRRMEALSKLMDYVFKESNFKGHIETALHVLGHCIELENKYIAALACYIISFKNFPNNNAAIWHIMRLLHQVVLYQHRHTLQATRPIAWQNPGPSLLHQYRHTLQATRPIAWQHPGPSLLYQYRQTLRATRPTAWQNPGPSLLYQYRQTLRATRPKAWQNPVPPLVYQHRQTLRATRLSIGQSIASPPLQQHRDTLKAPLLWQNSSSPLLFQHQHTLRATKQLIWQTPGHRLLFQHQQSLIATRQLIWQNPAPIMLHHQQKMLRPTRPSIWQYPGPLLLFQHQQTLRTVNIEKSWTAPVVSASIKLGS